jgi:membrane associated rhomboid family serine protease
MSTIIDFPKQADDRQTLKTLEDERIRMGISKALWSALAFFLCISCVGMLYFPKGSYPQHVAFSAAVSFGALIGICLFVLLLQRILEDEDDDDPQFPLRR